MKIKNDGSGEELEITQAEQKLIGDLLNVLNDDMKEMLLAHIAFYILQQDKVRSRHLMANWSNDVLIHQRKQISEIYERMTTEQKEKTMPEHRYYELFDLSVSKIRKNWENLLGLTDSIIVN